MRAFRGFMLPRLVGDGRWGLYFMTKSRNILAPRRYWEDAELQILRDLYPDVPGADIAALLDRPASGVHYAAAKLGLKKSVYFKAQDFSGRVARGRHSEAMRATQFKKGQTSWNKGLHIVAGGRSAETRFKKGQRPHTWVPIGSYRMSHDGLLERKETDLPGPNHMRWHPVHRTLWIAANGLIPKGHVVVFKPGQRATTVETITLDKLECISRKELVRRNHPRTNNPELASLYAIKGAITRQVNRIAREAEHANTAY